MSEYSVVLSEEVTSLSLEYGIQDFIDYIITSKITEDY
jgi:hypothetical protein